MVAKSRVRPENPHALDNASAKSALQSSRRMDPSTRIANHMNKDHQLALVDYLVFYKGIKLSELYEGSVKITAVDEKSMTLSYSLRTALTSSSEFIWSEIEDGQNVTVNSMKDIKDKLVAMAKYAAGKQGYSHVQVDASPKISVETPLMLSLFTILLIGTYDMELLQLFLENDPITSTIVPFFPDFFWPILKFAGDNIALIFVATYTIHIGEVIFVMIPKTSKHRTPFPQNLGWWGLNFIEGFIAIQKFNKLAK